MITQEEIATKRKRLKKLKTQQQQNCKNNPNNL